MVFIADSRVISLEDLMLEYIGDTVLRADTVDFVSGRVVGIARQCPRYISEVATCRQFGYRLAHLAIGCKSGLLVLF